MEDFKDYGTNDPDDVMVRELPNLERDLASKQRALKPARQRFAPGNPLLAQAEREYDNAVSSLELQKEMITQYRQQNPKSP